MEDESSAGLKKIIDATNKLEEFFKIVGLDFPSDMPESEEDIPKFWPEYIRQAYREYNDYYNAQQEEGIII